MKKDLQGFLESQSLAEKGAREVAGMVREGWTEIQAAKLLSTCLKDYGVKSFFHDAFAWFGERSGFIGMKTYGDFMPSKRVLRPGEVFILDIAPIFHGFVSDIGYTTSLGPNEELEKAKKFLARIKKDLPPLFVSGKSGAAIWKWVDSEIQEAGFTNAYKKYPFSVLGHRIHQASEKGSHLQVMRFGWQSLWTLVSRGLFPQLLTKRHEGELSGVWAIEPHLAGKDFGAKFEEILVVDKAGAYWLSEKKGEVLNA